MSNIFNLFGSIPAPKLKRNKFNLSHDVKLTTDFGVLTPMLIENTIPGETWKFRTETFCRLSPLVSPVMDRINIFNYYFKCPIRILMGEDLYNRFFVERELEAFPKITFTVEEANKYLRPGTLLDYLGYPVIENGKSATFDDVKEFSILPLLAYQWIYNEYFRDENLIQEIDLEAVPGATTASDAFTKGYLTIRNKSYKKDYFTSALPWTQKGPQATLPLDSDVKIEFEKGSNNAIWRGDGSSLPYQGDIKADVQTPAPAPFGSRILTDVQGNPISIDNSGNLKGSLENVRATINDLRYMTAMQRYLEAKARGGSRTAEWLLSIYGVRPQDLRLHRPEFLGSSKTPIVMSSVDQTSQTSDTSPQGYQAGKGVGISTSGKIKCFCDEHCIILGLSCVVPQNTYYQGCSRFLTKFDPYDYFIPQFQNLGEQAILKQELYYHFGRGTINQDTFGYQSRYSEYKFEPSRVHGDFRGTLNFFHLARKFGSSPALNKQFIEIDSSVGQLNRIFAFTLPEELEQFQHFWCEFYHHVTKKSPMKVYAIPSVI